MTELLALVPLEPRSTRQKLGQVLVQRGPLSLGGVPQVGVEVEADSDAELFLGHARNGSASATMCGDNETGRHRDNGPPPARPTEEVRHGRA